MPPMRVAHRTPTARDQQSGEYLSRGGGDSSRADALYDRGLDLVQAAEAGRSAAQSRAADPEQVRQEPQPTGTTPVTGGMVERSGNRGDGVKRLVHCPSPFKRLGGGSEMLPDSMAEYAARKTNGRGTSAPRPRSTARCRLGAFLFRVLRLRGRFRWALDTNSPLL